MLTYVALSQEFHTPQTFNFHNSNTDPIQAISLSLKHQFLRTSVFSLHENQSQESPKGNSNSIKDTSKPLQHLNGVTVVNGSRNNHS